MWEQLSTESVHARTVRTDAVHRCAHNSKQQACRECAELASAAGVACRKDFLQSQLLAHALHAVLTVTLHPCAVNSCANRVRRVERKRIQNSAPSTAACILHLPHNADAPTDTPVRAQRQRTIHIHNVYTYHAMLAAVFPGSTPSAHVSCTSSCHSTRFTNSCAVDDSMAKR